MYSAGQFSKSSSKSARKESNVGHASHAAKDKQGGSGGHGHGSGGSARKAAQQNRAKHRAEFEMQVGMSSHPIKAAPRVSNQHSGSSISQSPPIPSRRRKKSSGKGVAYICFGLLGGFFIVTGALLLAFGFSSDDFSWTSPSIAMILAYAGIGIFFIGFFFIFIFTVICCRDRRKKKAEQRTLEEAHFHKSDMSVKQNNNQQNLNREIHAKYIAQKESGNRANSQPKHMKSKNGGTQKCAKTSSANRNVSDGKPLPTTPT